MTIKQYDGYTSEDAPGYEVRIENNGDNICIYKDGKFLGEISTNDTSDQVPSIILQTLAVKNPVLRGPSGGTGTASGYSGASSLLS